MYVRNGEISRVGNMSQEYAVARIEVPVALTADVDEAEQVALAAATRAIEDPAMGGKKILGEPEMLGVQELAPDLLRLRMTLKKTSRELNGRFSGGFDGRSCAPTTSMTSTCRTRGGDASTRWWAGAPRSSPPFSAAAGGRGYRR